MMITTVYPEAVKYAWDDLLSEAGVERTDATPEQHAKFVAAVQQFLQVKLILACSLMGLKQSANRASLSTLHTVPCHSLMASA
jgi:Mlc titration factor MtfA (ptsG expression regulator)